MSDEHTERVPEPLKRYRELSDTERKVIDAIQRTEENVAVMWRTVAQLEGVDRRAAAVAKTEFQTAFMWLIRAVARPLDVFEEDDRG
jgi:hypothetical protein